MIPPDSKLEKTAKLYTGWLINLRLFKEHVLIMCESKVHVVVSELCSSKGVSES